MPTAVGAPGNCDAKLELDALSMISMTCSGVGLLIVICIGIVAIHELLKLDKICPILKSLVYISITAAFFALLAKLFIPLACALGLRIFSQTLFVVTMCGYLILILSLLATLITRLYHTFDASIYKMSNVQKRVYWIVYITIVIGAIVSLSINISIVTVDPLQNPEKHYQLSLAGIFTFVVSAILYFLTASWAVYQFTRNLLALARLQAPTMKNILSNQKPKDIKLSASQQKLINRTSRYVSLFSVGMIASIILIVTLFLDGLGKFHLERFEVALIIGSIDVTLHVVTLYLQYNFATKYYQRFCKCLEILWRLIFMKKIINSMRNAQRDSRGKYVSQSSMAESTQLTSVNDESEGEEVML